MDTALFDALEENDLNAFKELLDANPNVNVLLFSDIRGDNHPESDGDSIFFRAVILGRTEFIKELLEKINLKTHIISTKYFEICFDFLVPNYIYKKQRLNKFKIKR